MWESRAQGTHCEEASRRVGAAAAPATAARQLSEREPKRAFSSPSVSRQPLEYVARNSPVRHALTTSWRKTTGRRLRPARSEKRELASDRPPFNTRPVVPPRRKAATVCLTSLGEVLDGCRRWHTALPTWRPPPRLHQTVRRRSCACLSRRASNFYQPPRQSQSPFLWCQADKATKVRPRTSFRVRLTSASNAARARAPAAAAAGRTTLACLTAAAVGACCGADLGA